ncbi:MAG: sodium:calcium antiporter [Dehalococcoidia bacterium]|nr:sodium:calcium antiporter [Dehalococcoidia bacterium]
MTHSAPIAQNDQATFARLRRGIITVALAGSVALPGVVLRVTGFSHDPVVEAALFGLAILGAAFLLGAAGELAELEISASLALALVALVAILPEYAVDLVFAWKAAEQPEYAQYAAANMTGGNRLLIGVGWSLVVLLFFWKARKAVQIEKGQAIELTFLLAATAWAFTIFLRTLVWDGSLNIVDIVVLVSMYLGYLYVSAKGEAKTQHTVAGPMAGFAFIEKWPRRFVIIGLFAVSALVILAVAEPFAESLIHAGADLGVDEFVLVQWVAPLASEAPEIGVAAMFAWRGMGSMAMGVLISSKVNQWTLLVGTLPLVYSISSGELKGLPLDDRQTEEFLLTAAQSLFAILLLTSFRISWRAGLALLVLFLTQLAFTSTHARLIYSLVYLGLAVAILVFDKNRRQGTWGLVSAGVRSLWPSGLRRG